MHKQHPSAGSRAGCGAADDAARMSANAAGLTYLCFTPAICAAVRERRAQWAGARRIQRAALMKAISGARRFGPDCPAATPRLAADGKVILAEEIGRRDDKKPSNFFFFFRRMNRWPHAVDLCHPGSSPTSGCIHAELLNLNWNWNISLFFCIPASLCKTLAGKVSRYKFIANVSLEKKRLFHQFLLTQNNFAIQMQLFVLLRRKKQIIEWRFRSTSQSNPQNKDITSAVLHYLFCHFKRWIRRAGTWKQDKVGLNQKV